MKGMKVTVKKILSLCLMLILISTLIACSKTQNTLTASDKPSVPNQTSGNVTQIKKEILNYVIFQRGRDGLCVGLKNDSSDYLRNLRNYGLVSDVERLLWMASRSVFTDSEGEKKRITELPVIEESNKSIPQDKNMWFYDGVSSKSVWIRLNYQPFIPGQGMNVWGHKDLIVYIDPDNDDNAFLGIQDPQNQNVWDIHLLPGYGPWLAKEIDMLMYMTAAM